MRDCPINLERYLYDVIRPIFDGWNEDGIYAVSFFVYSNALYKYGGFSNVTNFAVSFNTEKDCGGAVRHSEKRWNYAFWRQNETPIFDSLADIPGTDILFDWYAQQGITNIGYENEEMDAPVGFKELIDVLSRVARRFQDEGYLVNKFGRPVPILIHDLAYIPCTLEATAYANPHGEADDFLAGNWESAELDCDDPKYQEIRSKISAIIGAVAANMGKQDVLDQIIEAAKEGSDPDVDSITKAILGNEYQE